MPNPIKYNTSTESNALKLGDFWIGTGDVSKGPTSITGYWNGITPPAGGYTVYLNKASKGPSISLCSNDADLIALTNRMSGNNYTTVSECLSYFSGQPDKVCFNRDYEGIVTDGLVLNLDAGFTPSYPKSGNTWYDISGNGNNGTLVNGPTFSGGSLVFDGNDNYTELSNTIELLDEYTITFESKINSSSAKVLLGYEGIDYIQVNNVNQLGLFTESDSTIITLENGWALDYPAIFTITRDNEFNITVFINGRIVGSGQCLGTHRIKQIGQRGNNQRYFNGYIKKLLVYNKKLTDFQVVNNFINLTKNDNIVIDGTKFISSWTNLANLTKRTVNSVINPYGAQDATLFERVSIERAGHAQIRQTLNLETDTWYSVSYWLKSIELLTRSDFEFSDNPQKSIFPTQEWNYYSFELKTNSTFPSGEFIDIGSTAVSSGSVLGEKYSIYDLIIKKLT